MKQRIIFGSIYVLVLLGMSLFSITSFDILYMLFMLIGLYEFHNMTGSCLFTNLYSSLVSLYASAYILVPAMFSLPTFIAIVFVGFVLVLINYNKNALKVLACYLVSIIYVSLPFILTLAIGHQNGVEYVVGVFVIIWFNDSFAYLTGRFFGKHKLFPSVSPNKTIEGLVGGVVISVLVGYTVYYYMGKPDDAWLKIIPIVAITANLGDLIQSSFKRSFDLKDSGNIIPGHGGILDRLDSYIYSIPFVYYLLN